MEYISNFLRKTLNAEVRGVTTPHIDNDSPEFIENKDNLIRLYSDLHGQTGAIDTLIYPAGSGDVYPVLLTNSLVIIDQSMFLNPANRMSRKVLKMLERQTGQVSVNHLIQNDGNIRGRINQKKREQVLDYARVGFERFTKPAEDDVCFDLIAGLEVIGGNNDQTTISEVENGFRLESVIQGEQKNITFVSKRLPMLIENPTFQEKMQIRNSVLLGSSLYENNTGLLIKGDLNLVSGTFIEGLPRTIIIDNIDFLPQNDLIGQAYTLNPFVSQNSYGHVSFGYHELNELGINIQIAQRI